MLPYTYTDLPFFVALPVLLIASGFFSGTETALFGLSGHQRFQIRQRGGLVGRAAAQLLNDERMLLITLMFGNMLANVLYFVVTSVLLLKLDPHDAGALIIAVATIIPLVVIIIFGEVVPKMIANTARVGWVRLMAIPMFAVHELIGPVRVVLANWVITPLSRLVAPPHRPPQLSADELAAMVQLSEERGVIDRSEEQLVREVMRLGQTKVRDVMVPRVDVQWLDVTASGNDVRQKTKQTGLRRFPVCDGDLDQVLGVVYGRQVLLADVGGQLTDLRSVVRNVRFVPELQPVDQLLTEFRRSGTRVAVAVDEYGGTAGIVTLRDVVERIVGDLDLDTPPGQSRGLVAERVEPNVWRLSGRLSVRDWAELFDARYVPPRIASVGGLIMSRLDRPPQVGDRVRLGNVELEVEAMSGLRVETVRLRLFDGTESDQSGGAP